MIMESVINYLYILDFGFWMIKKRSTIVGRDIDCSNETDFLTSFQELF